MSFWAICDVAVVVDPDLGEDEARVAVADGPIAQQDFHHHVSLGGRWSRSGAVVLRPGAVSVIRRTYTARLCRARHAMVLARTTRPSAMHGLVERDPTRGDRARVAARAVDGT